MIFLYILGGLVFLVMLILLIPLKLDLDYSDEARLTLKYAFLKIKLIPAPENEEKKKKRPEKPKHKAAKKIEAAKESQKESQGGISVFISSVKEKRGLSGLLELIAGLLKAVLGSLGNLISHMRLSKFDLLIVTGGNEPDALAIDYGKLCSAVYPALEIIFQKLHFSRGHISIGTDFNAEKNTVRLEAVFRITPIYILKELILLAVRVLIRIVKTNSATEAKSDDASRVLTESSEFRKEQK